ncbi:MAG TPA: hypothetical protein VFG10_09915 [Saprospiraceae bacterium]|nr:hypothetical protein [Saprospiraceae bacterium]
MIGFLIFIVVVVYVIIKSTQKTEAIGNWSHLFPDMQNDPNSFYELVEKILEEKQIPNFYSRKITLSEEGLVSHNRLYLEVSRGDYIFHICAAPWGTGFFFSWWVRQKMSDIDHLLILVPFVGSRLIKMRQQKSYYKLDTDSMFRKSVHQCVLTAIDSLTSTKGARGLSEFERRADVRSMIK